MRALVVHDAEGNIKTIVTMSPDAPPAALATEPGELLSEVELEDVAGEAGSQERHENLIKVIQESRIQVERGASAKLVPAEAE